MQDFEVRVSRILAANAQTGKLIAVQKFV